ncbi:deoxyribose-phosphate aldolase [Streptomyces hoynatensis]|uniref:Deoxyribose-phosphate aldolase n=2 Tax=Streptomyces hoynatensis TaxID=1141874 RepID=A0A3A9ZFA5_9ACTN|nr:deoxyribose-phosphate aldolase [Streptomyces hoynatensis]
MSSEPAAPPASPPSPQPPPSPQSPEPPASAGPAAQAAAGPSPTLPASRADVPGPAGSAASPPAPADPAAPGDLGDLGDLADVASSNATLRRFLHGLPGVDAVGLEARAQVLGSRSVKTTSKRLAIDLAISMVDLTSLEGADTPGRVRSLCGKALVPDPGVRDVPRVAAVCVYPDLVGVAVEALAGSEVAVASVATAFPSGRGPLEAKLADTRLAVAAGAAEIDMVIDRGAFLAGDYRRVFEEIVAVREACGGAHLKVILENGELVTYDNVRRASWLAMLAGADFVKTSTGKVAVNATPANTLVMLQAVRDFFRLSGRRVGVKAAGGIRTAKDAIRYLVLVNETLGEEWLTPRRFRLGASSLLNDLLMQRHKLATGAYGGPDYVTVD